MDRSHHLQPAAAAGEARFAAKAQPRSHLLHADARRAAALQRQQHTREARTRALRDLLEAHANEGEAGAQIDAAPAASSPASAVDAADASAMSDAMPSAAAATSSPSASVAASSPSVSGASRRQEPSWHRRVRFDWASRLTQPSWMESLPSDAARDWCMTARPEGMRCLVIATGGRTVTRKKNGTVMHRMETRLPGGYGGSAGAHQKHAAAVATILDCIWNEAAQAYLVLDACAWSGLGDALGAAEWRQIWLREKFAELGAIKAPQADGVLTLPAYTAAVASTAASVASSTAATAAASSCPFHLLPWRPCRARTFESMYPADPTLAQLGGVDSGSGAPIIRQDGFLFTHKQAAYDFGKTELQLQWKDAQCTPYFIDTVAAGSTSPSKQVVTLRLAPNRQLVCADGELAGVLDEYTYQTSGLQEGALLQYEIDGVDESGDATDAAVEEHKRSAAGSSGAADPTAASPLRPLKLVGLRFLKRGSAARLVADTRDKIIWQHHARTGQLLTARAIYDQLLQQEAAQQQQQEHQQQPQSHPSSALPSLPASTLAAPSADAASTADMDM